MIMTLWAQSAFANGN